MDLDVGLDQPARELTPVPEGLPPLGENVFEATDTFSDLDELDLGLLSGDEGLDMTPLPSVDYSDSDLDSDKDSNSNLALGAASDTEFPSNIPQAQEQLPVDSNPSPISPAVASSMTEHLHTLPARVKCTPRPPWRSIAKEDVKIEKLRNSLDFIEHLEGACKADSQLSPQDNERLWNPPRELLDTSNPALRQAVKTFMGADTPITVETFNA
ncbi:hypothetical protein DFH08DRAFT_926289, partial [Mycena albidolilacea]